MPEAIRREAGIPTMAVGVILDGPQAEAILQAGQADLIAIGREVLTDPHWALHAAQALGIDPNGTYGRRPTAGGWNCASGSASRAERRPYRPAACAILHEASATEAQDAPQADRCSRRVRGRESRHPESLAGWISGATRLS